MAKQANRLSVVSSAQRGGPVQWVGGAAARGAGRHWRRGLPPSIAGSAGRVGLVRTSVGDGLTAQQVSKRAGERCRGGLLAAFVQSV